MGGKGLTVNLAKTKVMISDINCDPTINSGKHPGGICCKNEDFHSVRVKTY